MRYRVTLRDAESDRRTQLEDGFSKSVSVFAVSRADARATALRSVKGKTAGAYAEIFEEMPQLVETLRRCEWCEGTGFVCSGCVCDSCQGQGLIFKNA